MNFFIKAFIPFFVLFILTSNNIAKADPGVQNLRNYYGSYKYENHKNKTSLNDPLTHELTFDIGDYKITTEFENETDVAKLKGKSVDIFGISFQNGVSNKRYMYGGITDSSEKLSEPRNIPINLSINGKNETVVTDKVSTYKKKVTAQEIDIKLRKYLQDEYNIYGHNKTNRGNQYGNKSKFASGFDTGKVLFHMNNGSNFSYDLFDYGYGQPENFLKIYKDNKTIDSEDFHLDVDISFSGKS